jgi:protein-tyrosine-phosphatase
VPEAGPGDAIAGSTLLVCTANICRSPMAEALWRVAAARLRRTLPVVSAGLDAQPGRPADLACVELLAERGIDLAEHRATRFTPADATRHELVLVMEPEHHRRIMVAAPMLVGRDRSKIPTGRADRNMKTASRDWINRSSLGSTG